MRYWLTLIAVISLNSTAHAQIGYISCVIGRPLPIPDILQDLLNAERSKDIIKPLTSLRQDDEVCSKDPTSKECELYKSYKITVEKSCVAYFRRTSNTSCWYELQLPQICEQYRKSPQKK